MQEIFKISSKYDSTKLINATSVYDFIDVFEDKMNDWYLKWALELNKIDKPNHENQHAGFAVLLIGFWYFESIEIFIKGKNYKKKLPNGKWKNESGKFFKKSFLSIFKNDFSAYSISGKNRIAKIAYDDGRCGMYHIGTTKSGIILDDGDNTRAIWIKETDKDASNKILRIRINRYKFIETIQSHLQKLVVDLRDKSKKESREKFIAGWEAVYETKIKFSA